MKTIKTLSSLELVAVALVMCAITCGGLTGCASVPEEVPRDLKAAELTQLAQDASDLNRYDRALQYYEATLVRFPNDRESVCEAEYEIAFLYYKKNDYAEAKSRFNKLLLRYNTPDAEAYPQQYKVLASKVLQNIIKKEASY
jgi:outer membrane protein assembly factor BamD (BamD/ComL family)